MATASSITTQFDSIPKNHKITRRISMKSIHYSNASIRHQLIYAQQKLMMSEVPLSLSAISYVRICCAAMRKFDRLKQAANPFQPNYPTAQAPYLNLLGRLAQEVPDWWTTCYVSRDGLLESNNLKIYQLLRPLNHFVQAHQACLAA
jgi:hypothetical protein